jgi:hypothetical protein
LSDTCAVFAASEKVEVAIISSRKLFGIQGVIFQKKVGSVVVIFQKESG